MKLNLRNLTHINTIGFGSKRNWDSCGGFNCTGQFVSKCNRFETSDGNFGQLANLKVSVKSQFTTLSLIACIGDAHSHLQRRPKFDPVVEPIVGQISLQADYYRIAGLFCFDNIPNFSSHEPMGWSGCVGGNPMGSTPPAARAGR